ncbi:MAG: flap endonuclease-1 [Candidatus Methylarchaceae archaeon HK02M1]|nr:flap endonuclease-1 [Candidatus Methylarchaceae archaeon HK02M1]
MGVDLKDIIKKEKLSLGDLSDRTLAIDAYNALYQFLSVIRGRWGEPLMDRQGRITSHLSGLFYRNINFLEKGIKLVYVLDGKPPELKEEEIKRRKEVKREATVKYEAALKAGRVEDARKYAQSTSQLKSMMVEDTKKLLSLMGIPWVQAPSEGEAQVSHMTANGKVWAAVSQDHDSLLFGATRLVRNLTISGKRKLPGKNVHITIEPELVELDQILKDLDITREQLIDIGILIGTDFNPDGFKGIGPTKALKLIKNYIKLESIPDIQKELASIDYQTIRGIFLKPEVTDSFELRWGKPDDEAIVDFLCHERDFSEARVRSAMDRLEVIESKRSETLERWFS